MVILLYVLNSFPDIVIEGETGYLVNVAAPGEIAEKIMHVYLNYEEAKRLAQNGRKLLLDVMDVNKTGKEVFDIYKQILDPEREYVQVYQKTV